MAQQSKKVSKARTNAGLAFLGVEVSWSFGDGGALDVKLERQSVIDIFWRHGFKGLTDKHCALEPITTADALKKALPIMPTTGDIVIKKMKRHNDDTTECFGVYRVRSKQGESGDRFVAGARVRVDPMTGRAVVLPPEGQTAGLDACMKRGERMADLANAWTEHVFNRDISNALCEVGARLGWFTRRRNKGGVWYMLADKCDDFVAVLDELEALTAANNADDKTRFFPSVTEQFAAPKAVKTWARESQYSLEDKLRDLKKDLVKAEGGSMRESTIADRIQECESLVSRADLYRSLLKNASDDIAKRVSKVREQFAKSLETEGASKLAESIEKEAKKPARRTRTKKAAPAKLFSDDLFKTNTKAAG